MCILFFWHSAFLIMLVISRCIIGIEISIKLIALMNLVWYLVYICVCVWQKTSCLKAGLASHWSYMMGYWGRLGIHLRWWSRDIPSQYRSSMEEITFPFWNSSMFHYSSNWRQHMLTRNTCRQILGLFVDQSRPSEVLTEGSAS